MYFCFRWVLIQFKREFSFQNIQRLWEVFWTDLPCRNFHLLFCVAILDSQMNTIIENKFGLTEILKVWYTPICFFILASVVARLTDPRKTPHIDS